MKYFGCILDFTDTRNKELMRAFKLAYEADGALTIDELAERIVNTPCSRFWVSSERAMVVVSDLIKGKPALDGMRPTKRDMFQEIFNRVGALKEQRPKLPLREAVSFVVHTPAPKFYMLPRSAMEIIYKIKKGFYEKQYRYNKANS